MKNFSKILLGLICLLGFTSSVNAASYSSSITASASNTKYEYVSGLTIYYHKASSYDLYVLDSGTRFTSSTTLRDPEEVDAGYAYIINNSSVTNSSYKNYYIAQAAILWYEDYLNGNNVNISASMKEYIASNTSDTVCYYINKLVNNAKNYAKNNGSINIIDKSITFTKNGSYYYSNVIDVETSNLNSTPSVKLYNAPTSATIINNTVTKDGEGSFQIRIPSSSLTNFDERDFEVYITGKGYSYSVYKYSNYGLNDAIYGRVYTNSTSTVEESMVAKIDGVTSTKVRINVIDNNEDYIRGLTFNIYSGDCSNSTCYSDDLVTSFTTTTSYTTLNNVLSNGTYTIVNKSTSSNYDLPIKKVINVTNTTSLQTFTLEEDDYDYDYDYDNSETEYDVLLISGFDDSTNIIKVYRSSGSLVDSFRADEKNYIISVNPGEYYIVDTKGTIELEFEISSNGLYINGKKNSGDASVINLSDYLLRYTQDSEDTYTDEDGTIHIGNLDGIESIEVSQEVNTEVNWLSNIIDCPITSLSSTLKYVVGAIILGVGAYLVVRNVKKSKNNI